MTNLEFGQDRLSQAHPLQAFELAQGSVEFTAQVRLVAKEAIHSSRVGNALPEDFHLGSFRLDDTGFVLYSWRRLISAPMLRNTSILRYSGIAYSKLVTISCARKNLIDWSAALTTMLQTNVHYVLHVHDVHKSLTSMGHYARDVVR
jgi:hypothetical protein